MILYDNVEDANSKLGGTYFYHGKYAVYCKSVSMDEGMNFEPKYCNLRLIPRNQKGFITNLDDPDLNFMKFNIGYCNHGTYAGFWSRNPIKQYKQGLRPDQMKFQVAKKEWQGLQNFNFNRHICDMMENQYPSAKEVEKPVRDGEVTNMAFHKDFAVSFDSIHKDFLLEYKGRIIGYSHDMHNFNFSDDDAYLRESLMEALG